MTYLADRLSELRLHLDHLVELRPRVSRADDLRSDRSLANDISYSLLVVVQRIIDVAAELSTRRGLRFEDFQEAVRNLAIHEEFQDALIRKIETLPELRGALIYGPLDPERLTDALSRLDGIERFAQAAAKAVQKRG